MTVRSLTAHRPKIYALDCIPVRPISSGKKRLVFGSKNGLIEATLIGTGSIQMVAPLSLTSHFLKTKTLKVGFVITENGEDKLALVELVSQSLRLRVLEQIMLMKLVVRMRLRVVQLATLRHLRTASWCILNLQINGFQISYRY